MMVYCTCGYHTCKKSYKTKQAKAQHLAGVKAAKKKKTTNSLKNKERSGAQKAAKTRLENYLNASAEEKARIDEIRHQAAVKAIQSRRSKKIKSTKKERPHRNVDWSIAVEKAQNTEKAALEVTKWRINQLTSKTKWQLVEFSGKKGHESVGIVDLLAIRKNHVRMKKKVGLKPGDLFDMVLIQVKGGGASWPSLNDIHRLQILARYYNADNVVLSNWKNEQLNFYRLKDTVNKKKFKSKDAWERVVSPSEIFP